MIIFPTEILDTQKYYAQTLYYFFVLQLTVCDRMTSPFVGRRADVVTATPSMGVVEKRYDVLYIYWPRTATK